MTGQATGRTGQGLGRERRLRRRKDFEALRERADSRAHPLLVMRTRANALPHSRFGFIVSKRVSPLAVTRNKVRRRLKEAVRAVAFQKGLDVLVIARKDSPNVSYDALRSTVASLARRLRALDGQERPPEAEAGGSDA